MWDGWGRKGQRKGWGGWRGSTHSGYGAGGRGGPHLWDVQASAGQASQLCMTDEEKESHLHLFSQLQHKNETLKCKPSPRALSKT